jgi:hypothetical protein
MVSYHIEEYETIPRRDESNRLSGCVVRQAVARRGQHTQNNPGKTT